MSGKVGSQFTNSGVIGSPVLGEPASGLLTNLTGTLTSPTFVTPALGTPASGVGTNITGVAGSKIGQMIQVIKTDTTSIASSTIAAISGMTKNITCAATSSKVRIHAVCNINATSNGYGAIYLYKGGSVISGAQAASTSSRLPSSAGGTKATSQAELWPLVIDYIDSPSSTSELTYAIYWNKGAETATIYLNRTVNDSDNANHVRGVSTLTLTEILA
jgi:hypothetical protein